MERETMPMLLTRLSKKLNPKEEKLLPTMTQLNLETRSSRLLKTLSEELISSSIMQAS
jgi:hypothetical protein